MDVSRGINSPRELGFPFPETGSRGEVEELETAFVIFLGLGPQEGDGDGFVGLLGSLLSQRKKLDFFSLENKTGKEVLEK